MTLKAGTPEEIRAAEIRLLGIRFGQAREVLLAISADIAQDRIEDPVGFHEREATGFFRIGKGVVDKLNKLLTHIG